jgi:hypothetical protein
MTAGPSPSSWKAIRIPSKDAKEFTGLLASWLPAGYSRLNGQPSQRDLRVIEVPLQLADPSMALTIAELLPCRMVIPFSSNDT